jgi:hypothetical protein
MRAMNQRNGSGMRVAAGVLGAFGLAVLTACGGGGKGADSPGNCPEGTVLRGSDCLPADGPSHTSDDEKPSSTSSSGSSADGPLGNSEAPASSGPSGGKLPYDKDSVEIELKRAARQVKANCGSATDDNGSAPGPWGKTTANVTLGRNGHVKDVSVPAPYEGQPDGVCAVNAFKKIQFPPYASSSDAVVPWDIEFVKPKH